MGLGNSTTMCVIGSEAVIANLYDPDYGCMAHLLCGTRFHSLLRVLRKHLQTT